jgi:hypothetical protein
LLKKLALRSPSIPNPAFGTGVVLWAEEIRESRIKKGKNVFIKIGFG